MDHAVKRNCRWGPGYNRIERSRANAGIQCHSGLPLGQAPITTSGRSV